MAYPAFNSLVVRTANTLLGLCVLLIMFTSGWLLPSDAAAAEPLPPANAQSDVQSAISFNDQIRPILSDRCYYCHGPDDKHREAGLRLDLREAATEDRGGGAAILPGDVDASLLIQRILETDDDLVMPPPHSKKGRLNEQEITLLRQWISQGSPYEPHWAFAPLRDLPPPEVKQPQWTFNPIDRFILSRLENANLPPSPQADRATLIRRVTLDLTGLLPAPADVDRFEADTRVDAYERLVDSLLASPHFAERWGRHWLDQARYADSNGYSIDSQRTMWPYRDWVIRAVGDDMPFDQFTLEQLAGDLLPNATKSQQVASAFHRNTLINQEGGTDAEQFRHESVVDRVNTTGAVWLGLTLGCAQCHTHKFDPIEHREYYELFAFFNSGTDVNNTGAMVGVWPGEMLGVATSPVQLQRAARRAELEQTLLDQLRSTQQIGPTDQPPPAWQMATWLANDDSLSAQAKIDGNAKLESLDDGSLLVTGAPDPNTSYRLTIDRARLIAPKVAAGEAPLSPSALTQIGGVRLRVLTHESLPKQGPGRAGNGNFVLTGFNLWVDGKIIRPSAAIADHSQPDYPVGGAIDDDPATGWAINVAPGSKALMNADHEAVFVFDPPLRLTEESEVRLEMHHQLNANYLVGRFSIELSAVVPAIETTVKVDQGLIKALEVPLAKRTPPEKKTVDEALRAAYPKDGESLTEPEETKVMVMADLPKPRSTFISLRGDFLRPDKDVGPLNPGGLSALAPALPASVDHTRVDLARWLVDPQNPLTPRVTVNRIWMRYFGRGLVETEEDFGTQGTPPTHPRLLDWLALQFQRQAMSTKALHRLIVTNATYHQSSHHRADIAEIDPRNRLLARQNRIRFEAEIVRDAALSASGELDRTMGGPSVHPPQPDGVYSFTQAAKRWVADTGANRFRRAMYTEFFRSAPHPLFTTFDAPDFQTVCTRRNRSNTPLQALTVANDEAFVELARALARRVIVETPNAEPAERLQRVFKLALSRDATAEEIGILSKFHDDLIDSFDQDAAAEVSAWLGKSWTKLTVRPTATLADTHAAALVAVCRTVLNTDNFITRE